jgi:hypothetical protein
MIDNDITDDELFLQANTNSEISDLSRLEEKYGLTADQILMRGFAIKNLRATLEIAEKQGITNLDPSQLLGSILIEEAIDNATHRLEIALKKSSEKK